MTFPLRGTRWGYTATPSRPSNASLTDDQVRSIRQRLAAGEARKTMTPATDKSALPCSAATPSLSERGGAAFNSHVTRSGIPGVNPRRVHVAVWSRTVENSGQLLRGRAEPGARQSRHRRNRCDSSSRSLLSRKGSAHAHGRLYPLRSERRKGEVTMCRHGATHDVDVYINAEDSHTGAGRWDRKPVDQCLASVIGALNAAGMLTRSSCCGHGKTDGEIIMQDGTRLVVPRQYSIPGKWLHAADPARKAGFEEVLVTR